MKTDDQIRHFKPRIQADLSWLVNSPDLLSVSVASNKLSIPLINASDLIVKAEPLDTLDLSSVPHQLGRYFEKLWFNVVRQQPDIEVLHENLQLQDNKQTIGEFDAILRRIQKQLTLHCELAVKFYLNVGDGKNLSDWVGPNRNDRLDIKYNHLISHQLILSRHLNPIININYNPLPIDLIGLFSRGRLYYPYEQYIHGDFNYPDEVNATHLKGFWVSEECFEQISRENNQVQWYVLPKSHWLANIRSEDLADLGQYQPPLNRSYIQVACIRENKELSRGFVVSEKWISKAQNL